MHFSPTKLLHGLLYAATVMFLSLVAGCGGGGSTPTLVPTYSLGGYVSGVSGTAGIVLLNNGGDSKTVTTDGSYTFGTKLAVDAQYNITVQADPVDHTCTVANGVGKMTSAGVTNANVTCIAYYALGGAVSGLTGTVVLQNNGGDNLTVTANGNYTFATKLADSTAYAITVLTQPSGQICTVDSNGTGTVKGAAVTANVTCTNSFSLGGTLTGVNPRSSSMVLRNNDGDDLVVAATDTSYVFATQVAQGTNYNVTVLTQPSSATSHEICTIASPTGTMPTGDLLTVNVDCSSSYTVGGTSAGGGGITGLSGNMVLQNNSGDDLAVAGSGTTDFTFSTPLSASAGYSVSILKGPYAQDCVLNSTASGAVVTGDVSNVLIACTNNPATVPNIGQYAYAANFNSNSVSAFDVSAADGSLSNNFPNTVNTGLTNPSSVVVHTVGANSYLYVTNYNSGASGYISAYQIDTVTTPGFLNPLAVPTIATGAGPYAITIYPSGKYAYVVNKTDNSVSAYSINSSSGALARIDTDGATPATQTSIATGTGPIAIVIHPGGGYAYVVNNGANTVSAYSIDAHTGALTAVGSPVATGTAPYSITIDPTGRYAYVANSASASISAYSIAASGVLTQIDADSGTAGVQNFPVGNAPKAVAIHPSGKFAYVANSSDKTVAAYSIDTATGALTAVGSPVSTGSGTASNPIAIRIDKSGQYAYVANYDITANILVFSINTSTGVLTQVGTAVNADNNPNSIATAP